MDRLFAIGEKYGIPIIEDAAEAIGSVYHGKRAGSIGKFGTFSFHGTKTLTTGEGGMFVTNDADLFERVLTLSNHGRARGQIKQFWPDLVGFKYKMSNLQAAIGCAQMERIDELIGRKREIMATYRDRLAGLTGISMNSEPEGSINGAWMPTVIFDEATSITREKLLIAFQNENIDARVFFWPLSSLPMFEPVNTNVIAWDIPMRAVNLPSYHDIIEKDLGRVIETIVDLYKKVELPK
jgi:perosamine synthetase